MISAAGLAMSGHVLDLEGGAADLVYDRGGPTQWGISSTTYPTLRPLIEAGALPVERALEIYHRDYYRRVDGYEWMEERAPDLLWLIFIGKIHGSGDETLARFIQAQLIENFGRRVGLDGIWGPSTAAVVRSLSDAELDDLMDAIYDNENYFASRRAQSVGHYQKGIVNRVKKEFDIALSYRKLGRAAIVSVDLQDGERWTTVRTPKLTLSIKA